MNILPFGEDISDIPITSLYVRDKLEDGWRLKIHFGRLWLVR